MEITAELDKKCKSLADICQNHSTEEKCTELLIQQRWGEAPICPNDNCGSDQKFYYLAKRKVFKCSCCKKQFSIRYKTIFANSNVSLYKWFMAIYYFSNHTKGISSVQLAKDVGVTQKTAWLMLHKIREAVKDANDTILDGIVEVDEAYCGARLGRDKRVAARRFEKMEQRIVMDAEGKNEKRSRIRKEKNNYEKNGTPIPDREDLYMKCMTEMSHAERIQFQDKRTRMKAFQLLNYKKNIFGIIERDVTGVNVYGKERIFRKGRIVLFKLGRQKGEVCEKNVLDILTKMVDEKAIVMTDECTAYKNLNKYFEAHHTILHSKKNNKKKKNEEKKDDEKAKTKKKGVEYVIEDEKTGLQITTNRIENVWNQFKRTEEGTFIHWSWKYTDRYLNEISYRWNTQSLPVSRKFLGLLNKALCASITRNDLYKTDGSYYYFAK